MKNKIIFTFMLIVLTLVCVSVVNADDPYTFLLTEAASKTDNADDWSLLLSAPRISGMSDKETEDLLNQYFLDTIDEIAEEYEEDKAYFQLNYDQNEMPRLGYEYSYNVVTDSDDYFVFRTYLFYSAGSSMTVNEYWTLNKHTGELVELSDLADSTRLDEIQGMILDEMKSINKAENIFWIDELDFNVVFSYAEEYQHWYVNDAGNLVFTFDKYEIAPGAQGESQFEIVDNKAVLLKSDKFVFSLYTGDSLKIDEENWFLHLNVPVIEGLSDKETEKKMNAHFTDTAAKVKKEYDEMVNSAQESVKEGNGPHFGYEYTYEILTDTDDYFAFKTQTFYAAGSSMTSSEFWTLDKNTGAPVEWKDIVTDEAKQAIHDKILAEMTAANEAGEGGFYTEDNSFGPALNNVPAYHHWYINKDGKLVITFDKYEVAVGAMGTPEFVIDLNTL